MKISIDESKAYSDVEVVIKCPALTDEVLKLLNALKEQETKLIGTKEGQMHVLQPEHIYYFESVDKKTFAYTKQAVYEVQLKLYEIEEKYSGYHFFRSSKSSVINISKIKQIIPSFSGRVEVILENNEKRIVSRQYVQVLKDILGF